MQVIVSHVTVMLLGDLMGDFTIGGALGATEIKSVITKLITTLGGKFNNIASTVNLTINS